MAYRRVPYLLPLFPSDFPEIRPLYALADSYKKLPSVLEARFTHGFFPADIEEMGMSALIITDGDRPWRSASPMIWPAPSRKQRIRSAAPIPPSTTRWTPFWNRATALSSWRTLPTIPAAAG